MNLIEIQELCSLSNATGVYTNLFQLTLEWITLEQCSNIHVYCSVLPLQELELGVLLE